MPCSDLVTFAQVPLLLGLFCFARYFNLTVLDDKETPRGYSLRE